MGIKAEDSSVKNKLVIANEALSSPARTKRLSKKLILAYRSPL